MRIVTKYKKLVFKKKFNLGFTLFHTFNDIYLFTIQKIYMELAIIVILIFTNYMFILHLLFWMKISQNLSIKNLITKTFGNAYHFKDSLKGKIWCSFPHPLWCTK